MPPDQPEYTLAEAAELIGRRPSTLRNQVQKGRLKARLVGKTYVVSRGELFRYVGETQPNLALVVLDERPG